MKKHYVLLITVIVASIALSIKTRGIPIAAQPSAQSTQATSVPVDWKFSGSVTKMRIEPSQTTADVCMLLPTTGDWLPSVNLVTTQTTYAADKWELINWRDKTAFSKQERCYRFTFLQSVELNSIPEIQIEVQRLALSQSEIITSDQCDNARAKLVAAASPVDFVCEESNGSYYAKLTRKPDTLTTETGISINRRCIF